MIPHGKHLSMRIFPSTFTTRCIKIVVTSLYVNAYFNRLRKIKHNGKHSRCLCGPNSRENKIREKANSSVRYSNHPRASRGVHASAKRPTKTRHPKPYAPHRPSSHPGSLSLAIAHAPGDGFGANTPPSLSSIQCLGAFKRFKCFFGPRAMGTGEAK